MCNFLFVTWIHQIKYGVKKHITTEARVNSTRLGIRIT